MQHTPSEVFHYTDSGGQSDTIHLSKSSTILQAAKRDLLGIIQLQVRGLEKMSISWGLYNSSKQICKYFYMHVVQCDTYSEKILIPVFG